MVSNKFLFFIFAFLIFTTVISSLPLKAQDSSDVYDVELTRERVRKIHGDFLLKLQGDWKSSLEGRVEPWKWTAQGWKCGTKEDPMSCAGWTPFSFQIFSKNFWQNWRPVNRVSFEVVKAKIEQARPRAVEKTEATPEEAADPVAVEAAPAAPIWGRNSIGELWVWKNSKGEELKVFLSARDSRIDRIEYNGQTEIFEWAMVGNRRTLDLSKLIIEKNGTQAVISKK